MSLVHTSSVIPMPCSVDDVAGGIRPKEAETPDKTLPFRPQPSNAFRTEAADPSSDPLAITFTMSRPSNSSNTSRSSSHSSSPLNRSIDKTSQVPILDPRKSWSIRHRLHDSMELYRTESQECSHDPSRGETSAPDLHEGTTSEGSDSEEIEDGFVFEKEEDISDEDSGSLEGDEESYEDEGDFEDFEVNHRDEDFGEFLDFNNVKICDRLLQEQENDLVTSDDEYNDESGDEQEDSDLEDDGFCFEDSEEESEANTEPPRKLTVPFWFSNEDEEHIKSIISSYSKELKLEEAIKQIRRAPVPFVGRIKRQRVENAEVFTTLDTVEIFQRGLLAPGSNMPLKNTVHFLTCWHYEEGLPVKFLLLNENLTKEMWQERKDESTKMSYISCLPMYGSTTDYSYFVSEEKREIKHSPLSAAMASRFWYNDYIPDRSKNNKSPDQFDSNEREFPGADVQRLRLSA
eukprot:TRINITY_DN3720_c0_g1_i1.p1 TRINITY_DN3720_c0_g1~~TRINITY_DN3720_c0_g1_i1.p1  ORF type:complete len:460 (+),score=115.68 TRINITY_DN3720_c0_g1_i1:390-1769(+)